MTTLDSIKATMLRHEMDMDETARYLGVSKHLVIKWMNGQRVPGPTVARLVEVLSTVETFAPAIHDHLKGK